MAVAQSTHDLYADDRWREDAEQWFKTRCSDELEDLWQRYPEKSDVWIDYSAFAESYLDLADAIVGEHDVFTRTDVYDLLKKVIHDIDNPVACNPEPEDLTLRFYNLGGTFERDVGDYWANDDLGEYRSVSGQISENTPVRPDFKDLAWECLRCGTVICVPQMQNEETQEPSECSGCERSGPFTENIEHEQTVAVDDQKIRLEKPPEEVHSDQGANGGEHLDVRIRGDLCKWLTTRGVTTGTRVTVSGVLTTDSDTDTGWLMNAEAVEIEEEQIQEPETQEEREAIRELASGEHGDPFKLICQSIAPSLYGTGTIEDVAYDGEERSKLWWIKGSTALACLFQGWRRPNGDGTFQRGTTHALLIGDPSTGKSTLMQAIEELSPISAATSGKGATAAGLTAAATQSDGLDGNKWSLDAGVLVLANGGVATVDEIDKMAESAVSSMHSALEKQRVEVSKAGINATLSCETSLLASGNPENTRFDQFSDEAEQINLVGSLLDRFGLIWTVKDIPHPDEDREKAMHVIDVRTDSGKLARDDLDAEEMEAGKAVVDKETIQKWVAMSRNYLPIIEDDAVKEKIADFYAEIRNESDSADEGAIPATTRDIEDLLRLAEASARMRLSDTVTMQDAETAITCVRASLNDVGIDPATGVVDVEMRNGGTPASQRDRIERVKGMIAERQPSDKSNGAPIEEILDLAESAGIDRGRAEHEIENLKQKGALYEPNTGQIRTS